MSQLQKAQELLEQYWKHKEFRPLQFEIIHSVLEKNDTFALLPTGGGKSVCFQIPTLMQEGMTLVISPLVALMKDQVQNLKNKGIKAIELTGGISENEVSDLLDNCLYGNYKFLYISPERLRNEWVLERIKNLPITLIAIDEAHCVSQWGNDFRPAYLKIKDLKTFFPGVSFLALTATATNKVQKDIIELLELKNPQVFKKSFARENLSYMVFNVEDKLYHIKRILTKNPEPSIIYVTNRKLSIDMAYQLENVGFKTTFYHGGLSSKEKENNMKLWLDEKVQVIVATNAFGMGIDKPNVKTVIHVNLPNNLENYYQEAGRAGRNGKKSFAVLLTSPSDIQSAEHQFINVLPDKSFIIEVYKKLCNYFQIAYGEGINQQYNFNFFHFCDRYKFPLQKTYNALHFLDNQSVLNFNQEFNESISAQFILDSKETIRYCSLHPQDAEIIIPILRTYPGIHELQVSINVSFIAKKANTTENKVIETLEKLELKEIVSLVSKKNDTSVTFLEIREDDRTVNRVSKKLHEINQNKTEQFKAVISYIKNDNECKSKTLLRYFGETLKNDCGICSYCINKKENSISDSELSEKLINLLKEKAHSSREIQEKIKIKEKELIAIIKHLLELNLITLQPDNRYKLKIK